MTRAQLADYLRVHPETIRRMQKIGLPAHKQKTKSSWRWQYDKEQVLQWFNTNYSHLE